LALCASLVLTLGLSIWFLASRSEPTSPEPQLAKPVPPAPPPKVEYQLASIDLRNRAAVRGEQMAPSEVVASLQRQPLDLRVYLPIGSEPDNYEVQIARDAAAPILSTSGTAKLENRTVILRVQVDLRDLAPGRYQVGIRKGTFRWMYYPVSVAD
jgi:hypothetical protein